MASFSKVAKASEIAPGKGKCVEANGKPMALFNVNGTYHALENTCTHRGGPLCEGELMGLEVECPWHGAHFNLDTGEAVRAPATKAVAVYAVRQQGDDIEVEA